jgi:parallel beta-helix repeat protein/predicted outer membrane repeat protein
MRAGILVLVLSIALPVAGIAATIHVPADHSSIQQAIDATGPGDTVLVGPGTYWENISFNGKAITVTSSDGPMKTYIDGSSPPHPDFGSVVFFGTWEGPGSVLDGFTVRLGTGTKILHDKRAGGGVFCKNASPTLSNNFIKINTATYGAGIYCSNASPSIKDCWFAANNGSFGSGIYCGEGSSPEIVNNVFYDNSGLGGGEGIACFSCSPLIEGNTISTHLSCGIRCNGYCSAVIKGNTITENKSSGILCEDGATPLIIDNVIDGNEGNDGAGILCDGANPQIKNNVIRNNKADEEGGGIACMKTKDMIISGNTISNNKAKFEGGGIYCSYGSIIVTDCTITNNKGYYGGGLCVYNQSDALLVGNDISHNQADQKGGGIYCEDSSTTVFECCTLHNNHAHGNGGGICCENESSITVLGCKLSNNSTYKDGGGICCIDEGSAVVKDCLIRNNSGESAGGFLCAHSRAIITGNVIIDNKGGERCGGLYVHFCEKVPQPDVSFNTVLRNTADLGAGIYLAGTDPIFTNNIPPITTPWRRAAGCSSSAPRRAPIRTIRSLEIQRVNWEAGSISTSAATPLSRTSSCETTRRPAPRITISASPAILFSTTPSSTAASRDRGTSTPIPASSIPKAAIIISASTPPAAIRGTTPRCWRSWISRAIPASTTVSWTWVLMNFIPTCTTWATQRPAAWWLAR